jgi:hypothetical protein
LFSFSLCLFRVSPNIFHLMVNPLLRAIGAIEPRIASIFYLAIIFSELLVSCRRIVCLIATFLYILLDALSDITHRPRREGDGLSPVHVVNVETKDTHEEATNGALAALDLMERVRKTWPRICIFFAI